MPLLQGGTAVIPFDFAGGSFLGVEVNGQFQIGGKTVTNQNFAVVGKEVTLAEPLGIQFFKGTKFVNQFTAGGGSQGILVRFSKLACTLSSSRAMIKLNGFLLDFPNSRAWAARLVCNLGAAVCASSGPLYVACCINHTSGNHAIYELATEPIDDHAGALACMCNRDGVGQVRASTFIIEGKGISIFSLDLVQGLGFKDGDNIGDDVPAIVNMFKQSIIPMPMFSVFLRSPSPPLKLGAATPTTSEIVLGGVSTRINTKLDLIW